MDRNIDNIDKYDKSSLREYDLELNLNSEEEADRQKS